ncbi:hypothetical protein [Propionibacterium freudenreichii]|uniref:hypothetical protein n=1 Tax=Propionibacterium freudenreichii TaxID=1744 RepID=UPI0004A11D63|nr:hypothetical protein [Propionibacterium freudenreichii]MCT2998518.1 hypothetical protein [Propionibacterium freudenreichii]MDK9301852.1 hypothetical protein [Propionibacterium freudenreichii]MDK9319380.1 hypothetical protein [Propionibacterium freudenreichii]MDK9641817.1 hypothetical protein [Propionibacterium freudenreichii]CDP48168.1 Protein of unknown function [Propionibacterium freudenreichii subsp. freudenreichii]
MLDHKKIRNIIIGAVALVVAAVVVIVIAIEHAETRRQEAEAAAASSASVFWNGEPTSPRSSAASPSQEKLQQVADVTLKVVSWKDSDGKNLGATDPMIDDKVAQTYKAPWPEVLDGKTGAQVYMLGSSTDPHGDHTAHVGDVTSNTNMYQTTMVVTSYWRATWWEQAEGQSAVQKSYTSKGTDSWGVTYDWATDKIIAITSPHVILTKQVVGS